MRDVVVVSAVRTALGSIGGTLKNVQPETLLATALEGALAKAGVAKEAIDEVICGQAKQSTDQPNISRLTSLMIRIPEATPAYTVHRQCASGMQAILSGTQQIQCGYSDIILCGGVESMSTAPFYIRGARFGVGSGNTVFVDPNVESQPKSQPNDIYGTFNMIWTADEVARRYNITREECDAFALQSQRRAIAAIDSGRFKDEIVPVTVPQGRKNPPLIFDTDEFPRRDTSLEKMAKLKPVFNIKHDAEGRLFNDSALTGTVTAASSSGRNDGASAVLLMSEEKAKELGLKPLARIIGMGTAGADPRTMGLGPVGAVPKALANAGLKDDDIQLIELNEAFAAQSIGCIKQLGWENKMDIINVNGGAIALGHPVGSSGCRIIVTLVHEMKKRGLKYGLATLCIAGGMGQATVVEMCE